MNFHMIARSSAVTSQTSGEELADNLLQWVHDGEDLNVYRGHDPSGGRLWVAWLHEDGITYVFEMEGLC